MRVCDFLKTQPSDMIKTLIFQADDQVVAVLVRGDHEVNLEKLHQLLPGCHIELADEATIQSCTGAAVGFAGPIGLVEQVDRLMIDYGVAAMATGVTGANKTDTHVRNVVPGRDFPLDGDMVTVTDLRNACEGGHLPGQTFTVQKRASRSARSSNSAPNTVPNYRPASRTRPVTSNPV